LKGRGREKYTSHKGEKVGNAFAGVGKEGIEKEGMGKSPKKNALQLKSS